MEWTEVKQAVPFYKNGVLSRFCVLTTYEAQNKDKKCVITLTGKDKRSSCELDFLYEENGEWYSDGVKKPILDLRWKEAKNIAERWLSDEVET